MWEIIPLMDLNDIWTTLDITKKERTTNCKVFEDNENAISINRTKDSTINYHTTRKEEYHWDQLIDTWEQTANTGEITKTQIFKTYLIIWEESLRIGW